MTTPKPLTRKQRDRADRAHRYHEELLRLTGAAAAARGKRDDCIAALLSDGVAEFVVVNETGVARTTVQRVGRKARK